MWVSEPWPGKSLLVEVRFLSIAVLLAAVAGCVMKHSALPDASVAAMPKDWMAVGKLGYRHVSGSGSVNFVWQQSGDGFHVELFGPLGLGRVVIEGGIGWTELTDSRGRKWRAGAIKAAMVELLGWYLPPAALSLWLQGRPTPFLSASIPLRENGFRQGQWQIRAVRNRQVGNLQLPRNLVIMHPDLRLVVAIREWRLQVTSIPGYRSLTTSRQWM